VVLSFRERGEVVMVVVVVVVVVERRGTTIAQPRVEHRRGRSVDAVSRRAMSVWTESVGRVRLS
jgi:hypothetical protein